MTQRDPLLLPSVTVSVHVNQFVARALRVRASELGCSPQVVYRMALEAFLGRSDGPLHPSPRGEGAHWESIAGVDEWGHASTWGAL